MIRIGPAGVPLSCKGRTTLEGIQHVQGLGLNAMEVQFVRGIRMDEEYALEVGELAELLDVELACHAPYYTNLVSEDEGTVQKSIDKIAASGYFGDIMKANLVVGHVGFYGDLDPEEAFETAVRNAGVLRDHFRDNKFHCELGLEVMGKQQTFGSLEEIVDLCQEVEGVVPVVDFAHIHARRNGGLQTKDDFLGVFDALEPLDLDHVHSYFTGVRYLEGSERHHVPIKKSDLDPEPLLEAVLERDLDITIISNSPILEHDAMVLKLELEKVAKGRELEMDDIFPPPQEPPEDLEV